MNGPGAKDGLGVSEEAEGIGQQIPTVVRKGAGLYTFHGHLGGLAPPEKGHHHLIAGRGRVQQAKPRFAPATKSSWIISKRLAVDDEGEGPSGGDRAEFGGVPDMRRA